MSIRKISYNQPIYLEKSANAVGMSIPPPASRAALLSTFFIEGWGYNAARGLISRDITKPYILYMPRVVNMNILDTIKAL